MSKSRPPRSVEEEENELINLATNLARKQLEEGTASSQVITHFLKLGSTKEKLENEKLRNENELLRAKTSSINAQEDLKNMFNDAISAMKSYQGADEDEPTQL